MRRTILVAMCCLGSLALPAWSAEPADGQAKRRELIKRQQVDNSEINHVSQLVDAHRSTGFRPGASSAMRIASDYLIHLRQARDARAADVWKSLDIKLPLTKPLSHEQLDELSKLIEVFQDSNILSTAHEVLWAHDGMESSETSVRMLNASRQKPSTNDSPNEQGTSPASIALQFIEPREAFLIGMYLDTYMGRYLDQWRAAEIARIRPLVPSEQAASRRLNEAFAQYCRSRDKSGLQQSIAEMVEDYPETTAARTRLPDKAEQLARQQLDRAFDDYMNVCGKERLQAALADIVEVFPGTAAAKSLLPTNAEQVARKHLDRVFACYDDVRDRTQLREQLADIVDIFPNTQAVRLHSSINAEQLASKHLSEAHEHFRQWKDKAEMKSELAAIVEVFPKTEAARRAGTHLEIVQRAIQAEAEHARRVRDYWDSVYPSRVKNSPKSR